MKLSRHKERIIALQILFSLNTKEKFNFDEVNIETNNIKKIDSSINWGDKSQYFYQIIEGVINNQDQLDQIIAQLAIDWDIERMPRVDLNILRIALLEIRKGIPEGVAINEAVELAKEFGSDKSPGFINGILARSLKV